MYFAGRWMPIELMNELWVLWLIAAVIVCGLMFYLHRRGKPKKPPKTAHSGVRRRPRHRHKTH
jgi:hypothetical protein